MRVGRTAPIDCAPADDLIGFAAQFPWPVEERKVPGAAARC